MSCPFQFTGKKNEQVSKSMESEEKKNEKRKILAKSYEEQLRDKASAITLSFPFI